MGQVDDDAEERPRGLRTLLGEVCYVALVLLMSVGLLVASRAWATAEDVLAGAIGVAGLVGVFSFLILNGVWGWGFFSHVRVRPQSRKLGSRRSKLTIRNGVRVVVALMGATGLIVVGISVPRMWLGPTAGPVLTASQGRLILETPVVVGSSIRYEWDVLSDGPEREVPESMQQSDDPDPCSNAVSYLGPSVLGYRGAESLIRGNLTSWMVVGRYADAEDARSAYGERVEYVRECEQEAFGEWGRTTVVEHSSSVPLWAELEEDVLSENDDLPSFVFQYGNVMASGILPAGGAVSVESLAADLRQRIDRAASAPSGPKQRTEPPSSRAPQPPSSEPPSPTPPVAPPDGESETTEPGQEVVGGFQSPSGNIVCYFLFSEATDVSVSCAIYQRGWGSLPPKPEGCPEHLWGAEIRMDFGDMPKMICAEESDGPSDWPVLEYGDAEETGPMSCESRESGVVCRDVNSEHAFFISSESYEIA